ncbi:peptidase [Novosphingobium sp. PS1R-30]|uniref:Peptidase n=1 Tax=Novosphingobium anseongense TaxID=3133436 RepID=A0ABU8RWT3_9SPHN
MKTRLFAALLAASAFGLSGCVTDDYGYGGVSLGYGTGYGGGGYYGDPYWGWYDDFYYPGAGYYIYDRGGTRHRWNDRQRAYWEGRRGSRPGRNDWSGFRRDGNSAWRGQRQPSGQGLTNEARQQRREAWQTRRQQSGQGLTDEARQQRREAWQVQRQQSGQRLTDEARQQRREAWQAQRQQRQQSGEGWQGRPRGPDAGGQGSSDRGWGGRRQQRQ